ncbi:ankyrin repeat domain-containing protein [Halomonas sp. H10-59]|uniref:Ankyrin repeat domain-containing protein n=1 Tax=Halomonas sp. H10-59 TaxID=2950874 RepID=A0AAU7KP62_9GAMM
MPIKNIMPREAGRSRADNDQLFISYSRDMKDYMERVRDTSSAKLQRAARHNFIEAMEWRTWIEEQGIDQLKTYQENILRPSDPRCIGVICLLGERIGEPLSNFQCQPMPDFTLWTETNNVYRYRLKMPGDWPSEPKEQQDLVDQGWYPLTGPVFEVLDAWQSFKDKPNEEISRLFVCYFSDSPVSCDKDEGVCLNGRSWYSEESKEILDKTDDHEKQIKWTKDVYMVQTGALINFIKAFSERSLPLHCFQSFDEAGGEISKFVKRLTPESASFENPYRGLDYYDMDDPCPLPGRSHRAVDEALKIRCFLDDGRAYSVRIVGESGCGKSSFLRRGLLAELAGNGKDRRNPFPVVAVRPGDLHDSTGRPDANVLEKFLDQVTIRYPLFGGQLAEARLEGRLVGPRAPTVVTNIIEEAIKHNFGGKPLVVGLDQFEEIVDDLANAERRPYADFWGPFLAFIEEATKRGVVCCLYTIEKLKVDYLDSEANISHSPSLISIPTVFLKPGATIRLSSGDEFLTEVIESPFLPDIQLDGKITRSLIDSFGNYNQKHGHLSSPLPLLSLLLEQLYERAQSLVGAGLVEQKNTENEGGASPSLWSRFHGADHFISYEEVKDYLDLDNEVGLLVEQALPGEAKSFNAELVEDEKVQRLADLNFLFKPLVGLSNSVEESITLRAVGDGGSRDFRDRIKALADVRLVVNESNGLKRFIHQSVIRQWPLANEWLKSYADELELDRRFRRDSLTWRETRGDKKNPQDRESIHEAAVVLYGYIRYWPFILDDDMTEEDRALKNYCQSLLSRSDAPKTPVERGGKVFATYAHIAAMYGMDDTLEEFIRRCPECIECRSWKGRKALDAAAWTSSSTVRMLLRHDHHPLNTDVNGWPTIAAPIWQKNLDIFELLLPNYENAGWDSLSGPDGTTMLHIAALRGASRICKRLMSIQGFDPEKLRDRKGFTPLHYAAMTDKTDTFEIFCHCLPINAISNFDDTVLHMAAAHGSIKVVERIKRFPSFSGQFEAKNKAGKTPLMLAAENRHAAVVALLAPACDVNRQNSNAVNIQEKDWTALHYALAGANREFYTEKRVASGQEVNKEPETRASRQAALRTVKALLDSCPDIDFSIRTEDGIHVLERAKFLPLVRRYLMTKIVGALPDGSSVFNHMITTGDRRGVESLLAGGEVTDGASGENKQLSLELLIQHGMGDIAVRLMKLSKFDPWERYGVRSNGLVAAIYARSSCIFDLIVDKWKAKEHPGKGGFSHLLNQAVIATIRTGQTSRYLSVLLEMGARPLYKQKNTKRTLLHTAAMYGDLIAYQQLVEACDKEAPTDEWGLTPGDLAPETLQHEFERAPDPVDLPAEQNDELHEAKSLFEELADLARRGNVEALRVELEKLSEIEVDDLVDEYGRRLTDLAPESCIDVIESMMKYPRSRGT